MVRAENRRQLGDVGPNPPEEMVEVGVEDTGGVEAQSKFDRSAPVTSNIPIGWPTGDRRTELLRQEHHHVIRGRLGDHHGAALEERA